MERVIKIKRLIDKNFNKFKKRTSNRKLQTGSRSKKLEMAFPEIETKHDVEMGKSNCSFMIYNLIEPVSNLPE
jgi:hypothetical protein